MNQNKTVIEKAKDSIKNLPSASKEFVKTKKGKKVLIVFAVLVLIVALLSASLAVLNNNQTAVYNKIALMLMPESLEDVTTGRVYYVEENKDYDPQTQSNLPLEGFNFYYYDSTGERVDVPNGYLTENGQPVQVSLGFVAKAVQRIGVISNVVSVIVAIIVVAVIIGAIFIAYRIWLKKEIANDEKLAKNTNRKK